MVKRDKTGLYRNRVLSSLRISNQLTRSQVAMGPLVHVPNTIRDLIMESLTKDGLIETGQIKGPMGPPATVYRITASGRKHCDKSLKNGDSSFKRPKIIRRESGARDSL